jgi:hypothetical protein
LAGGEGEPRAEAATVTALAALVASIALPTGGLWANVQPAGGKLLVWGWENPGRGCVFLRVDPRSLRSHEAHGDCSRTTRLTPEVGSNPRSQWQQVFVAGRLAFTYDEASDTKVEWTYGAGSLWVYDVATRSGPQLLRYSLRTGRLRQRLHFPAQLYRPVLAANDDGAWLMAATNGGESGKRTAALYHVVPGARTPAVLQQTARAAMWMVGTGHTLWLETVTGYSTFRLWRYDGTRGRVLWRLHRPVVDSATYGDGALWGVTPACDPNIERLQVVELDPASGARSVVASIPELGCDAVAGSTLFHGAFWVVDGDRLYRITP